MTSKVDYWRASSNFFKKLFSRVWFLFQFKGQYILGEGNYENKVWVVVSSRNNYFSTSFLGKKIKEVCFISTHTDIKTSPFPELMRFSFHSALLYVHRFPYNFFRVFRNQGLFTFKLVDKILFATGMMEACEKIIHQGKPRAIIFANDHNIKNRGLLLAANKFNVPTIYIQHASVSKYFPPLSFSLNLLEGKDSLEKYSKIGPVRGKVAMIGMPKFDDYVSLRNVEKKVKRIGICTNGLDDLNEVEGLIFEIAQKIPSLAISYRAHPRDTRILNLPSTVVVSDSNIENIFSFLGKQDLIFAGDTSTHLEATMLNVLSIYYRFDKKSSFDDYYGFLKKGMIEKASNHEDGFSFLEKYIIKKPEVWQKASFFNSALGTEFEGKSKELAVRAIKEFLSLD